ASGTWEPQGAFADLRGARVLALDDEADATGLLRAVLEAAGAEVATFSSAQLAFEQLGTIAPDVMIVDLGMPGMDGFEFISRVRASENPAIRDVPAAALTAFARSDDRTRALQAGFELHLAKPVDPAELVAAIVTLNRQAVRARAQHRAVESRAPLPD
ncbi:MAG: response regulator, partial [Vicinamibacterales bacterium]